MSLSSEMESWAKKHPKREVQITLNNLGSKVAWSIDLKTEHGGMARYEEDPHYPGLKATFRRAVEHATPEG